MQLEDSPGRVCSFLYAAFNESFDARVSNISFVLTRNLLSNSIPLEKPHKTLSLSLIALRKNNNHFDEQNSKTDRILIDYWISIKVSKEKLNKDIFPF